MVKLQKEVTKIVKLTDEVLNNKYGVGEARKKALGDDYDLVQWNVNRVIKERENK